MSDYKREVARLFSQQLINRLTLTAEMAVLDVAAGRIIGIDISEKMTAKFPSAA